MFTYSVVCYMIEFPLHQHEGYNIPQTGWLTFCYMACHPTNSEIVNTLMNTSQANAGCHLVDRTRDVLLYLCMLTSDCWVLLLNDIIRYS